MEISRRTGDWVDKLDIEISRALYLRWLGEIAFTFTAARETIGDHPYARVQLLSVPQAHAQQWSHLIFAGWNEGSWPPRETGEFARQDEIDAFNRSIQKLNRRASRQGRQGEGHTSFARVTPYLGPAQQRQSRSGNSKLSLNQQLNKSPLPPTSFKKMHRNDSGIRANYSRGIIRRRITIR